MDACSNLFLANAIYNYVHHNEYTNMYIMVNNVNIYGQIKKNNFEFFSWHVVTKILSMVPWFGEKKDSFGYDDMAHYSTSY
jgi:hypothetical protein